MVPARVEKTTVLVGGYDASAVPVNKSRPYEFQVTGEVIRFRGFLQVFEDKEEENGEDDKNAKIPAKISEGMELTLLRPEGKQMFTMPPARYTESSLVKTLDQLGIGRPSTYAQIISTIIQRKYVEILEKKLHATDLGMTVNKILVENFPDIFNVEFTAFMEDELDKIASGDLTYLQAMEFFFQPFSKALEKANANRKDIKASIQEETGIKCEKCGRPMIIKWGRNGKFLACSGYPECKNTRPLEEDEPKETDHKCPKCGAPMVLKKGRYGDFLACSNYPKCKTTMAIPTGVKCPREGCDGDVVQKRSKRGKIFFGCSNYPKCDFATWDKPVAVTCPVCENNYLLEKNTKAKGRHFHCPSCKTTFNPEDIKNERSA
jgi:DNA topoisomerase-1